MNLLISLFITSLAFSTFWRNCLLNEIYLFSCASHTYPLWLLPPRVDLYSPHSCFYLPTNKGLAHNLRTLPPILNWNWQESSWQAYCGFHWSILFTWESFWSRLLEVQNPIYLLCIEHPVLNLVNTDHPHNVLLLRVKQSSNPSFESFNLCPWSRAGQWGTPALVVVVDDEYLSVWSPLSLILLRCCLQEKTLNGLAGMKA